MATEVIMPALGVSQETGRVLRWLKAAGDQVVQGEPLVEIETDKVTFEMEAPASGVLGAIDATVGEDVPVGRPIGLILAPGEDPEPAVENRSLDREPTAAVPGPPTTAPEVPPASGRRGAASPLARRRAREAGVDLERVPGSGPGGAATAADVDAAIAAARDGSAGSAGSATMSPIRRRMVEHVCASWEAPQFSLAREVDARALVARRAELGEGITVTDLLVWASARALGRHPHVNARWEAGAPMPVDGIHVGIAVALDDGLIVPVVRGADRLDERGVAERRADLVRRARSRELRPDEVGGGSFTVSNLGMFGVDSFTAIVNGPEAAILAVGRVADRVVAVDGRPEVRPRLWLTLSCDHRVVDGAGAARFLDTLAVGLEEPSRLEP